MIPGPAQFQKLQFILSSVVHIFSAVLIVINETDISIKFPEQSINYKKNCHIKKVKISKYMLK